jgi:hypothetical protein
MILFQQLPYEIKYMIFEFLPGSAQGLLSIKPYYKYTSYVEEFTETGYSLEYIQYCIDNDLWLPFNRILMQMKENLINKIITYPNGVKRSLLSVIKINMTSTSRYKKCYKLLNLHLVLSKVERRIEKIKESDRMDENEKNVNLNEMIKIKEIIHNQISCLLAKYGGRHYPNYWIPCFNVNV